MTSKQSETKSVPAWIWLAATAPLGDIHVYRNRRAGDTWAQPSSWWIEEDGKTVAAWREIDAPGLGTWLDSRLSQLRANWYLAYSKVKSRRQREQATAASVAKRRGVGSKRQLIIDRAVKLVAEGKNPFNFVVAIQTFVAAQHKSGSAPRSEYVRRVLEAQKNRD